MLSDDSDMEDMIDPDVLDKFEPEQEESRAWERRGSRSPIFIGPADIRDLVSSKPFDAAEILDTPTLWSSESEEDLVLVSPTVSESPFFLSAYISPPQKPVPWMWTCHLCLSRYPLGVTRRCLIDGHYYCSGDTRIKQRNIKRRKRGVSCTSVFDYNGWEEWFSWRRSVLADRRRCHRAKRSDGPFALHMQSKCGSLHGLKGCENCEFPSQCRHAGFKVKTAGNAAQTMKEESLQATMDQACSSDRDVDMTDAEALESTPVVLNPRPVTQADDTVAIYDDQSLAPHVATNHSTTSNSTPAANAGSASTTFRPTVCLTVEVPTSFDDLNNNAAASTMLSPPSTSSSPSSSSSSSPSSAPKTESDKNPERKKDKGSSSTTAFLTSFLTSIRRAN